MDISFRMYFRSSANLFTQNTFLILGEKAILLTDIYVSSKGNFHTTFRQKEMFVPAFIAAGPRFRFRFHPLQLLDNALRRERPSVFFEHLHPFRGCTTADR